MSSLPVTLCLRACEETKISKWSENFPLAAAFPLRRKRREGTLCDKRQWRILHTLYQQQVKGRVFYLIRALDGPGVDTKVTVKGPFDLATFEDERQRLGLPSFTRELTYLK